MGAYDAWRNTNELPRYDADWEEEAVDWDEIDFTDAAPELYDALIEMLPTVQASRQEHLLVDPMTGAAVSTATLTSESGSSAYAQGS